MTGTNINKFGALGLALMVLLSAFVGSFAFVGSVAAHSANETTQDTTISTINSSSTEVSSVSLTADQTLNTVRLNVTSISGTGNVTMDVVRLNSDGTETVVKTDNALSSTGLWSYPIANESAGQTYEVRLSTDDANTTAEVSYVEFEYLVSNTAPTANAGANQTVTEGSNVTFNASASADSDGDNLTYEWDYNGDGVYSDTGVSPTEVFYGVAVHDVTLRVTDEHGASTTDTVTITVENAIPVADAGPNQSVQTGSNVTFDGSGSSDPAGGALTYDWDFDGDGTVDATGVTPVHSFASAGDYTATLTVTEPDGATATDTVTITVSDATYATSFNVTDSAGVAVANATINVSDSAGTIVATLTTDANGSAVANLADGNYTYDIASDGYDAANGSFSVAGASQTIGVSLVEASTTTPTDGGAVVGDGSGGMDSKTVGAGLAAALFALLGFLFLREH